MINKPTIVYSPIAIALNDVFNRRKARDQDVCMIHLGRCGSTVIGDLLNRTPGVDWAGEYLGRIYRQLYTKYKIERSIADYLKLIEHRAKMRGRPIFGIEVKPWHVETQLFNIPIGPFLVFLSKLGFTRFIFLERRNYLRRLVSGLKFKMGQSNHNVRGQIPISSKVNIDINSVVFRGCHYSLIDLFRLFDDYKDRILDALPVHDFDFVHINYEDHIRDDPIKGYSMICDMLHIRPTMNTPSFDRTSPFSLEDMISNYNEVAAVLQNTRYSWMLAG